MVSTQRYVVPLFDAEVFDLTILQLLRSTCLRSYVSSFNSVQGVLYLRSLPPTSRPRIQDFRSICSE